MSNSLAKIAECQDIFDRKGGVISDMLDQVVAWFNTIDIKAYTREGLHQLLHYVYEVALPRLMKDAPASAVVVMNTIVIPLLKKIDEAHFHTA